ncbi:MAG: mechanosensitive ion channel family protein [Lachnospiraceae bacterium]|nr:mechanosensitive ion channel family protein [Lachnospiraceae bacterium]
MQVEENTKKRIWTTVITGILAIIVFGFVIQQNQNRLVISDIRQEMKENMDYIVREYTELTASGSAVQTSYKCIMMENLYFLEYLSRNDPDFEPTDEYLASIVERMGVADIMIVDRKGRIKASASGTNNALTDSAFDGLRTTFDDGSIGDVSFLTPKDAWDILHLGAHEEGSNPYELYNLYSYAYSSRYEFVITEYAVPIMDFERRLDPWMGILRNMTIGAKGFAFCWSDTTKELTYYPDDDIRFLDVSVLDMDFGKIADGAYGWNKVNGEQMYLYTEHVEEAGVWIACAVPEDELISSRRIIALVLWGVFVLFTAAIVYYAILLLKQKRVQVLMNVTGSGEAKPYISRQRRLAMFTALLVVLFILLSFYMQTLYPMSTWAEESELQLSSIEDRFAENYENASEYVRAIEEMKNSQMKLIVWYMQTHAKDVDDTFLNDMCLIFSLKDATWFNELGTVKTTCSDQLFRYLNVNEMTAELEQMTTETEPQDENVYAWMDEGARFLTPMYNATGNLSGYFYARYYSDISKTILTNCNKRSTLQMVQPGEGGFIFAVDTETGNFIYYPDAAIAGRNALEFGLTETQLRDNYHDFININNSTYYAATRLIDTDLVFYVISNASLFRQRMPLTIYNAIFCILAMFFVGLPLYTSKQSVEKVLPSSEGEHTGREVSAEFKVYHLLGYYLAVFAVFFALYSILRQTGTRASVLDYVLDGNWERGMNVFALTAAIIVACELGAILFVARKFVNALADVLPFRGGTIVRMLTSLATYLGLFYIAYRCLICFGMNPTTLMTSAGIVSVVVGIGANSLVGDFLAGIFLLAEGDIQVGDVVKVGEFRGYVLDMGIRRTKMFDMDTDNVRIIPNKGMMDAVHMSMHPSVVYSRFLIGYDADLDKVEGLLRKELDAMTGNVPYLIGEIKYLGVSKLTDNGVELFCMSHCHEAFRYRVERAINRRVLLMFKKNGIEIPYPQLTVHEADEKEHGAEE